MHFVNIDGTVKMSLSSRFMGAHIIIVRVSSYPTGTNETMVQTDCRDGGYSEEAARVANGVQEQLVQCRYQDAGKHLRTKIRFVMNRAAHGIAIPAATNR